MRRILVANRGEIACRVFATARRLGYETVAVYSDADADAPHVRAADIAVRIGPPPVSQSYLVLDAIIEAAVKSGADGIHPGYGFLSENPTLPAACVDKGITFIGPPAEAMRVMGDKIVAKATMRKAGVPTAPSGTPEDAAKVGFPLLVKAAAGGGGRGMRAVRSAAELADAVSSAQSEALSAFGSGEVFLERLVEGARHVEIQVFADTHGNAVHLGERECSVQRRHQKVIEEAPSPAVDETLRAAMGEAAVKAAQAIGYVGAGTVEFLLDDDGDFYFLEMNTRLQVEHPVTELVTGLDLVQWQLDVAEGKPLPMGQGDLVLRGHAIEARLYAEDPDTGFMPQVGTIDRWRPPVGVRVDSGIRTGSEVSPFYDPMIAKIVANGRDREEARRRLIAALRETRLLGLRTNQAYLVELLASEQFAAGEVRTDTLDREVADRKPAPPSDRMWALAAVVKSRGDRGQQAGWRSTGELDSVVVLTAGDNERTVRVSSRPGGRYEVEGTTLRVVDDDGERLRVIEDDVLQTVEYLVDGPRALLADRDECWTFEEPSAISSDDSGGDGSDGTIRSPIGGRVVSVSVSPGDAVAAGTTVAIVEAMKMEHRVVAQVACTVDSVSVAADDQVTAGQILVAVTPTEET